MSRINDQKGEKQVSAIKVREKEKKKNDDERENRKYHKSRA